jgi:hypothetical protein
MVRLQMAFVLHVIYHVYVLVRGELGQIKTQSLVPVARSRQAAMEEHVRTCSGLRVQKHANSDGRCVRASWHCTLLYAYSTAPALSGYSAASGSLPHVAALAPRVAATFCSRAEC